MEENIHPTIGDLGVNKSPMNEVYVSRRFLTNIPCDRVNYMRSVVHGCEGNSHSFTDENSEDDSGRQESLFYRERPKIVPTKKKTDGSCLTRSSFYAGGTQSDKFHKTLNGQRRLDDQNDFSSSYLPTSIFHTDSSTKHGTCLKYRYKPDRLIQTVPNPTMDKQIANSRPCDDIASRKNVFTYDHFKNSFIDEYDVKRRKQILSRSLACGNMSDHTSLPIVDVDVRNKGRNYEYPDETTFHDPEMDTQRADLGSLPLTFQKYDYLMGNNGSICGQMRPKLNFQNDVEIKYKNKEFHEEEAQKKLFKTQETGQERGIEPRSLSESTESNAKNVASLSKICVLGDRKGCSVKGSARSHRSKESTISREKFDNMVNLEKSKCNTMTVIDDGLHRLQNSRNLARSNLPEKSIRSINDQSCIVQDNKHKTPNVINPELLNNMFKEYRGYHLENMKQEIKRIQYLDSLPEKWTKKMFSSV